MTGLTAPNHADSALFTLRTPRLLSTLISETLSHTTTPTEKITFTISDTDSGLTAQFKKFDVSTRLSDVFLQLFKNFPLSGGNDRIKFHLVVPSIEIIYKEVTFPIKQASSWDSDLRLRDFAITNGDELFIIHAESIKDDGHGTEFPQGQILPHTLDGPFDISKVLQSIKEDEDANEAETFQAGNNLEGSQEQGYHDTTDESTALVVVKKEPTENIADGVPIMMETGSQLTGITRDDPVIIDSVGSEEQNLTSLELPPGNQEQEITNKQTTTTTSITAAASTTTTTTTATIAIELSTVSPTKDINRSNAIITSSNDDNTKAVTPRKHKLKTVTTPSTSANSSPNKKRKISTNDDVIVLYIQADPPIYPQLKFSTTSKSKFSTVLQKYVHKIPKDASANDYEVKFFHDGVAINESDYVSSVSVRDTSKTIILNAKIVVKVMFKMEIMGSNSTSPCYRVNRDKSLKKPVKRFLDVTKLDAGKVTLTFNKKPLDINMTPQEIGITSGDVIEVWLDSN